MLTIVMKDLLSEISDDLICQLVSLPIGHEPHKLWEWFGQVVLVVEQVDDPLSVLS